MTLHVATFPAVATLRPPTVSIIAMDGSLITFLSGLRISPELAAFIALVVLFLAFIWRAVKFGVDSCRATQAAATASPDARLASIAATVEKVADKFQAQLDRFEQRGFEGQLRFQEQVRSLTETNVVVNREHIAALTGIQAAFQSQAARLDGLERVVVEISRARLESGPRAGRTTTTKVIAEEVTRIDPPRPPGPAQGGVIQAP
jgi:hypothetical protein